MSQELNQSSSNNAESNGNQNQPKRNNNLIYLGVIGVLLVACIYLFISKNKVSDQRDNVTTQLDTVSTNLENTQNEYNAALARLDNLTSKNAQLDSAVNSKDGEIAKLKSEIQGILRNSKANASDLARAKSLINLLNSKVKSYEERIAELEGENKQLNQYNETVTKERDSTVSNNIALSQKVRLANVLHASNIRMVPIELRRGGKKEKETTKAKRVDVFRITFDIDENRIAEDGTKDLYICIRQPNGDLLSNSNMGSGETSTFDGKTLKYTTVKHISLKQNQPVKDIVIDWHQDNSYERGTYSIEIYNEGYKIGDGSINLR